MFPLLLDFILCMVSLGLNQLACLKNVGGNTMLLYDRHNCSLRVSNLIKCRSMHVLVGWFYLMIRRRNTLLEGLTGRKEINDPRNYV